MESYPQPKPCADGNGTPRAHAWMWYWTEKHKWPNQLVCQTCGQKKDAEDLARRVIG